MSSDPSSAKTEIMAYYRQRAGLGCYATSPDFNLREVEITALARHLRDQQDILDIGCGNGYSTLSLAAQCHSHFRGVDFVPEMVAAARNMAGDFKVQGQVEFLVGDVTALAFPEASFDLVLSERCLLNLPTRADQWEAMRQIARVLRPGGRYLMLEGTLQGLARLNDVRGQFGLSPVPEAAKGYNWFSNKFDEPEMLAQAKTCFSRLVGIERFGMYYFISRVVHALLVAPEEPRYDARINAIARQLTAKIPDFQEMGHVALFVFEK